MGWMERRPTEIERILGKYRFEFEQWHEENCECGEQYPLSEFYRWKKRRLSKHDDETREALREVGRLVVKLVNKIGRRR